MDDFLSYEQEAELSDMLEAINARIEVATEELRRRIDTERVEREIDQLERLWRV